MKTLIEKLRALRGVKYALIFLVALTLIFVTLFGGENVILTDNGDYARVMRLTSLYRDESGGLRVSLGGENAFSDVFRILFDLNGISGYPSSQLIFVRLSVIVNLIVNALFGLPADTYNVYYLGALYGIFYAAALTFFLAQIKLKNKYLKIAVSAAVLLVMCDIGYVGYFNSLYGEGLQHICFVFFAGFLLRAFAKPPTAADIIPAGVILVLYGTSKPFNIPCAIIFGLVYLIAVWVRSGRQQRFCGAVSMGLAVCILIAAFAIVPKWMGEQTHYNSVFFGTLRNADDETAKERLRDLGLDEELYVLKNTNYYVSDAAALREQYDVSGAMSLSHVDLLMFHATHPGYTLSRVPDIMRHSDMLRNVFFMDDDYMDDAFRLTAWSGIRENTGFGTVAVNIIILLMFFAGVFILLFRRHGNSLITYAVPLLLVVAVGYAFIMPFISNGYADLGKHMYVYIEFVDMMVVLIILGAAHMGRRGAFAAGALALTLICGFAALHIHRTPETVSLGRWGGEALEWYVIDENAEYRTLIAAEPIATMQYDTEPDNTYETSSIRAWLGGEFLEAFTETESALLRPIERKVLLSTADKYSAELGNRDYYCTLYPEMLTWGYDDAYGVYMSDYAVLPNAELINHMADSGCEIAADERYWLETCYFNNGQKVRYVDTDGLVYFDFADEAFGIRPVIRIKNTD